LREKIETKRAKHRAEKQEVGSQREAIGSFDEWDGNMKQKPTMVSLFSGCGGLDLGFKRTSREKKET
jgi:hypothetical protein